MRIELDNHLSECALRMETCEHCNKQVAVSQMAHHHVLLCPKFPVNCPICGEAEILRESINSHINIINGVCPMVIVPCSFRHIGCMHQDKRSKMPQHYIDANTHHLMLLSTRLVDLETKNRLELQICAKKFEQNSTHLCDKYADSETKIVCLENELNDMKRVFGHLKNSVKELKILVHSNEFFNYHHNKRAIAANTHCNDDLTRTQATTSSSISPQNLHANSTFTPTREHVFEWLIELSNKRKAYFSPSYCLPLSSYKVHLWLKPEIEIDNDLYSTVCVILERCDNEDELPVSFDCCFFLTNDCSTADSNQTASARPTNTSLFSNQLKSFVTTDSFQMSGHVSKPMVIYKTSELKSRVFDNNKLNLQFTIRAIREFD